MWSCTVRKQEGTRYIQEKLHSFFTKLSFTSVHVSRSPRMTVLMESEGLLDWSGVSEELARLGLQAVRYQEGGGDTWYRVMRDQFDLFMLEEPYHSLTLLVNLSSGEFLFRVLGTTRERGFYSGLPDLLVCRSLGSIMSTA